MYVEILPCGVDGGDPHLRVAIGLVVDRQPFDGGVFTGRDHQRHAAQILTERDHTFGVQRKVLQIV